MGFRGDAVEMQGCAQAGGVPLLILVVIALRRDGLRRLESGSPTAAMRTSPEYP